MKNKIVFDLDGVLRDNWTYFNRKYGVPFPDRWDFKYEDKNIFDWVKYDNFKVLEEGSPTKYYTTILTRIEKLEIWTSQSKEWIPHTELWLKRFLPNATVRYLKAEEKFEELQRNKNIYLVEDYPLFPNYERVILIDTGYNRNVNGFRVTNVRQLDTIIRFLLNKEY